MDRSLQLDEHVVAHLVTARAEGFRVRELHAGIESPPEEDACDEASAEKEAQREMAAAAVED
jgi:hypothetical protein